MAKKLKILQVGKFYYPYRGGMESVVRDICEGQVERGHEVQVLCSNECFKNEEDMIKGVRVHRMALLGSLFSQNLNPSIIWKLRKMAKEFDIVHIHSPNPIAELMSLFLPKSTKIVVTYHSDIIRQKLILPFYAPILKMFLKRVDNIHVATNHHIKYSPFLPKFESKCTIIPFGLRENQFQFVANVRREVHRIRQQYSSYVLFVGRLVGYKGLPTLLEAIKLTNRRLIIIGKGPMEKYVDKFIKENKLEEKIFRLGRVDHAAKFQAYFYACESFVLPSNSPNENFGVVQLEAMACGKPVIVSNLKSGVSAVGVRDKTSLFFEPNNVKELAQAINTLADNPTMAKEMGLAGRDYFLSNYTFDQMAARTEKSYYEILGDLSNSIDEERPEKKVA